MDFDMSKENIQPLRGGRNRAQLEMALQAQNDEKLQRELLQTKTEFENMIRNYEGDDPLNNWYSYISWIEQSFPKHGHEGNLLPILEDCLGKFENDERYVHDRRFCKLWIKYIDVQQNPDELYQLLHSKGICVSCSDLYRTWAFYHQVVGDFKRANAIYQLGLQALAQPYEELELAQKNMLLAAERMQEEEYEQQMVEQRQALTSLRSYKHHSKVASVRTGRQVLKQTPGLLPATLKPSNRSNQMVSVYVDENSSAGAGAAIKSVLEIAQRQATVHKENTMKPGPWTKLKLKKRTDTHHLTPSFKIHEDEVAESASPDLIHLYPDFCAANLDDFNDWKTLMFIAEPEDSTKIPMYPKNLVYCNNVETSLEEIIAKRYLIRQIKSLVPKTDVTNENKLKSDNCTKTVSYSETSCVNENAGTSTNFRVFEDETPSCSKQINGPKAENLAFQIYSDSSSMQIGHKMPSVDLKNQSCTENINVFQDEAVCLQNIPYNADSVRSLRDHEKKSFEIYTDDTESINNQSRPRNNSHKKILIFEDDVPPKTYSSSEYKPETNTNYVLKCSKLSLNAATSNKEPHASTSSVYKETGTPILPKDVHFTFASSKSQKNVNDKVREHVRSLITRTPTRETDVDTFKINYIHPHQ